MDGEHYAPVVEAAFDEIRASGHDIAAAVFAGGSEKQSEVGETLGSVPLVTGDPVAGLASAIDRVGPDAVVDLSDEPVLDNRRRFALASVALARGVAYRGPGYSFDPPPRPRLADRPSVAVIATGKRTGKTAVAGYIARTLTAQGASPVVVAMGRGGPPEPEVLRGDQIKLGPAELLALADQGKHAASDYIEDALLARVPTIGCRRCGGGVAGAVDITNFARGVAMANEIEGDVMILEGSGAAIPPAHADATVLIVPSSVDAEYLKGYLGPYRLLLADLVVGTMCEDPFGSPSQLSSLISEAMRSIQGAVPPEGQAKVITTVFRPTPTDGVNGRRAVVATTAPAQAADSLRSHLRDAHGCEVVGMTHSLSDRSKLGHELQVEGADADLLLCEVKAAGVDVATRWAMERGIDVVYLDNEPVAVGGSDLGDAVAEVAALAHKRFREHPDKKEM